MIRTVLHLRRGLPSLSQPLLRHHSAAAIPEPCTQPEVHFNKVPTDGHTDRPQQQVPAKLQSVGLIWDQQGRLRCCGELRLWLRFGFRFWCYVMLRVNGHCSSVKLSMSEFLHTCVVVVVAVLVRTRKMCSVFQETATKLI